MSACESSLASRAAIPRSPQVRQPNPRLSKWLSEVREPASGRLCGSRTRSVRDLGRAAARFARRVPGGDGKNATALKIKETFMIGASGTAKVPGRSFSMPYEGGMS
jgi:hypothetical protein